MIPKIVPVTEFRSKVLEAVRKTQNNGQEYVITAKGKPAAVLVNFDEWESILETLEIKQDKRLMRAIEKGKKYFRRKKGGKLHTQINWN